MAEGMLRPIALSHPDCPEILLAKARIEEARGNANQAVDLYIRYTDLEPNDSRGFAYFGRLFLEQRDYMKADALSAAAVDKNPSDPAALALRGQILVMKGQSAEGKTLLEKACQLDPDDPEAQFQLGAIYDRAKSAPNAVQHFRKAATLNPRDSRAWDYLALNLEPMGDLAGAEAYLLGRTAREYALKEALEELVERYEVLVLDCPPSLGVLTINALTAADQVLIPLQCETLSHRGVGQLLATIEDIRRLTNRTLRVVGLLPTMYDGRTRHARETLQRVGEEFGVPVLDPVPKSIRFAEAPASGVSILGFSSSHPGALAYRALSETLIP